MFTARRGGGGAAASSAGEALNDQVYLLLAYLTFFADMREDRCEHSWLVHRGMTSQQAMDFVRERR